MEQEAENKCEDKPSWPDKVKEIAWDYLPYIQIFLIGITIYCIAALRTPSRLEIGDFNKNGVEDIMVVDGIEAKTYFWDAYTKYIPSKVERRDINNDGVEDIIVGSNKGISRIFYGIASGDSVVYRSLEQIKAIYQAEAEKKFLGKR